jgi:hypothetical protein
MIIEDGTGKGYKVAVNSHNQIDTFSTLRTHIGHVSYEHGNAYSLPFSQASAGGADDPVLYLKNDDDIPLILSQMWITCSVADVIYAKLNVTGTAAGGTAPVPVNLNSGSGRLANVTTRMHTSVTNLSGGDTYFSSYFTANAISQRVYFEDAVILTKNATWALYVTTGAANTLKGQLLFFFADE